ncbi:MAG: nitroreductase family protein [Pseudomonadota bacterium]
MTTPASASPSTEALSELAGHALPAIDVDEFRKIVRTRRAIRRFTAEDVPDAVLDDCLDLAMLAPNSCNLQPWNFYVVRDAGVRQALAHACLSQNAAKTAPVLIPVIARTATWSRNCDLTLEYWPDEKLPGIVRNFYRRVAKIQYWQGPFSSFGLLKKFFYGAVGLFRPVPRGPYSQAEMRLWAAKSCALAAGNLMLALRAHGYDSCPMEGFDEVRVRKILGLPGDAFVVMIVAAGKRGERSIYHSRYRFPREQFITRV